MSYSFREKPKSRLSDRLRGKSGDELFKELRKELHQDRNTESDRLRAKRNEDRDGLFDELKEELDQDRKTFFDSNPNWVFPPAGSAFPRRQFFDDDDGGVTRGRTDLRAHLDDLANRHPEFADHLRSPPGWVSDFPSSGGTWGKKRSSSKDGFYDSEEGPKERRGEQPAQHDQVPTTSAQESAPDRGEGLGQHGLRNTAPDIGPKSQAAADARNQRSMSAPPDSNRMQMNSDKPPQARFVSKIEINPVNPATGQTAADAKPPMAPPKQTAQQQPPQQPPPQHKQSAVRHIPIFVEGRDEPVLPKNMDQDYTPTPPPPTSRQAQYTAQHQFQPPNQQQRNQTQPSQAQQHHQQFQQTPPPQHHQPQDQTDSVPPKPSETKINQNDPIYRVQVIQKEVDDLRKQIDTFSGNSRSDKEYVFLDEMLTRNLIKLDDIITDGKENIRAARKEAIKSIQHCISVLESKVPVPQEQRRGEEEEEGEEMSTALVLVQPGQNSQVAVAGVQPMETSSSQEGQQHQHQPRADDSMSVDSNGGAERKGEEENFNEIKC